MFTPVPWYRPIKKMLVSRYQAQPLSEFLQRLFSNDGDGREPALLDSDRLKKGLMVVVRNLTTGSAWPLTNNPNALFNDPKLADCNLKIPLWKVVRASTAAPVYFDPEEIMLDDKPYLFVDGAITPYNNPALIAGLTTVLPCYNMNWETGTDKIRLISVGTMRFSSGLPRKAQRLWLGYNAASIPVALMDGVAWQQDFLCRCLGECIYGEKLDSEIGTLIGMKLSGPSLFSYVRYNKSYSLQVMQELLARHPALAALDAIHAIPALRQIGAAYAQDNVTLEHLI
jgi:patatin-like phospholipase/acyl hydrolase